MRSKKILSCFLILVLLLQLLPVKQVISYFFIDNQLTEEITEPGAKKLFNEDKIVHLFDPLIAQFFVLNKTAFLLFSETLPTHYTAEIPTPPPNHV